jgi:hypothetical protein
MPRSRTKKSNSNDSFQITANKTQKPKLTSTKILPALFESTQVAKIEEIVFAKEYWTGDSRDGAVVNGDGYHFYRMTSLGEILDAYEFYETDDGRECVAPLPEMIGVHWQNDLGFEDFEALDFIKEYEFDRIKEISTNGEAA